MEKLFFWKKRNIEELLREKPVSRLVEAVLYDLNNAQDRFEMFGKETSIEEVDHFLEKVQNAYNMFAKQYTDIEEFKKSIGDAIELDDVREVIEYIESAEGIKRRMLEKIFEIAFMVGFFMYEEKMTSLIKGAVETDHPIPVYIDQQKRWVIVVKRKK